MSGTPTRIDAATVLRLRRVAHGLLRPAASPVAAVRRMLAVQGQDVVPPLLAVGIRSGADRHAVDAAFESGALVRSWPMRGTLHVLAADDLTWLRTLTAARGLAASRLIRERSGVTDAVLDAAALVAERALGADPSVADEGSADHQPTGGGLRRPALLERFADAGIAVDGNRGYLVLTALAMRGVLCIGVRDGTQYRFHLERDRTSPAAAKPMDRDEALGRLAHRYLAGHGPATERDLAWWSSLTLTDARRALAIAGDDITPLDLDGTAYYAERRSLDAPPDPTASDAVSALPGFDEYYLGYADRSLVLPAALQHHIAPTSNGRFLPTIVADGRVVATWSPQPTAPRVHPIGVLDPGVIEQAEHAAAVAAAWLGAA